MTFHCLRIYHPAGVRSNLRTHETGCLLTSQSRLLPGPHYMNMTILVVANIGIQQSDVPLQQEAPGLIKSGGGKAWDAVASARNDLQREGEQPPDYRQVRGRAAQAT